MARVRVMAVRLDSHALPLPKLVYRAEVYVDADDMPVPFWQCRHIHTTPLDAHACGTSQLQQLSNDGRGIDAESV
ncbi:MAG TPA: hypothetical protein VGG31_05240 [Candidatus Dormibacteraeota bacterium]|jgi:hypothetical protein